VATFNFYGDNHGRQNVAARDIIYLGAEARSDTLGILHQILASTAAAAAAGRLQPATGDQVTKQVSQAIASLEANEADSPEQARSILDRVKKTLVTAALVPELVDAVAKAIDHLRKLC
jgi:hypothetical protein